MANANFDRILICIPSLSRPEAITKKTLALVKNAGISYKIFVEPQETFLYKYYCGKDCIVTLPESGRGIGYSRNRMRDYAREKGYEFIFELDDDIDEFTRLDTNDKQESLRIMLSDYLTIMDQFPKCGGIRVNQYRFWLYTKKDMHKWIGYNFHLIWATFMRLSAVPPMSDDLTHFEDMAISLAMMRNGYFTLTYGLCGGKVQQNIGKGGCNCGNRKEIAQNAIPILQNEFPHILQKGSNSYFGVNIDVEYYEKLYNRHSIKIDTDEELIEYLSQNCLSTPPIGRQ